MGPAVESCTSTVSETDRLVGRVGEQAGRREGEGDHHPTTASTRGRGNPESPRDSPTRPGTPQPDAAPPVARSGPFRLAARARAPRPPPDGAATGRRARPERHADRRGAWKEPAPAPHSPVRTLCGSQIAMSSVDRTGLYSVAASGRGHSWVTTLSPSRGAPRISSDAVPRPMELFP